MSQATVESILEQAANLSPDERLRLGALLINGQAEEEQTEFNDPLPKQRLSEFTIKQLAAMTWIAQNADKYVNQWVALDGARLVAHGVDFKEVLAAARADSAPDPLYHFCEPEPERPFVRV